MHVCCGAADERGARKYMEDRHVVLKSLQLDQQNPNDTIPRSFFAVYDGHSSHHASGHACQRLHQLIGQQEAVQKNRGIGDPEEDKNVEIALEDAFNEVDNEILELSAKKNARSGTTAVCALLINKEMFVAHCGDSRAVLAITAQGGGCSAMQLTRDHKPASVPEERMRIEQQGGLIAYADDRVYSNPKTGEHRSRLNMSRALGDASHKFPRRLVESKPDVISVMLSPDIHRFLVLGSDGLFDVMSSIDVVSVVDAVIQQQGKRGGGGDMSGSPDDTVATMAAQALIQEALRRQTMDNVTAVVVIFVWNED